MGIYAVVKNDMVEKLIVLNDNQIEEFENLLNAKIINAIPFGLCRGDLQVGENWTRNLNGVQTILKLLTSEQQIDYIALRNNLEKTSQILINAEQALIRGVESIE